MRKVVSLLLVVVLVMGLVGMVSAEEVDECPAAPDVAGQILKDNDIDFRYEDGTVEHPRQGTRVLYSNYIATVAHQMTNGAAFPDYQWDRTWDGTSYAEKCDVDDYYWAVYNYLRFLGADLDCQMAGVLDPVDSGATFEDNGDGTGTLTVTLVDLCGNPILPEDFPIIPPTVIYDIEPANFQNYFRANAKYKYTNDNFNYIGASWFPVAEGYGRANHLGDGVYTHTITKPFGYDDVWEIGIGPWVRRVDVYVIEDAVEIKIAAIYTAHEQEGTFTSIRHLPGLWNYDITIAKDVNDEFAWGTITLIDPNNEKVEAVIKEIKYDYAYWSSYYPNLAAVGNVTYLGENYYFMFLYAKIALWMGISDQSYDTYWENDSVFLPASIRVYDIHSELTNDFVIFW